jgi:hypothetical protein
LENRNSVDQRRQAAARFIAAHRALLARQGSFAATWRTRAGRRTGPYFLLVVRDAQGRQRSVYLGVNGKLAEEVRAELARLQAPERERRVFCRVKRQLRRALARAQQELDRQLAPAGLWRKGSEIRGWRTLPPPAVRRDARATAGNVRACRRGMNNNVLKITRIAQSTCFLAALRLVKLLTIEKPFPRPP